MIPDPRVLIKESAHLGKLVYPVTQIDDYVKHFFREAVRGLWEYGRSGCGVLIKGVDRDRWITISRIAEPLKACTAMAAEVVGVSVLLSGTLDLVLVKTISLEAINQYGRNQACVFKKLPRPMFWYLLPALVIEGRVYRRPSFDEKEGEWSREAPMSLKAKSI